MRRWRIVQTGVSREIIEVEAATEKEARDVVERGDGDVVVLEVEDVEIQSIEEVA